MAQAASPQAASAAIVATTACTAGWGCRCTTTGGVRRIAGDRGQTRLKISVPLVPPKPKLFFAATSIFIGRASLAQ